MVFHSAKASLTDHLYSLMVVVIINISVKPPPYLVMRHKVRKRVSLQHGERACYVVPKRRRIDLKYDSKKQRSITIVLCV